MTRRQRLAEYYAPSAYGTHIYWGAANGRNIYIDPDQIAARLASRQKLSGFERAFVNTETLSDRLGNRYSAVFLNRELLGVKPPHLVLPPLTGTHQDELFAYRLRLLAANRPDELIVAVDPLGHGASSNPSAEIRSETVRTGSFMFEGRLLASALIEAGICPRRITAFSKNSRHAFGLAAHLPAEAVESMAVFDPVGSTRFSYSQIVKAFLIDEMRHDRLYVSFSTDQYELEIRARRSSLSARLGKAASYLAGLEKIANNYLHIPRALSKGARRPDLVFGAPIAREIAAAMNRQSKMCLNYVWFKDSHLKLPKHESSLIRQLSLVYGNRFRPLTLEATHAVLSGNAALGQTIIDLAYGQVP